MLRSECYWTIDAICSSACGRDNRRKASLGCRSQYVGGGLMVAVIQVAITAGATVGGLLYDGGGYRVTFLASAVLLLLAGTLAFVASRVSPPLEAVEGARAMH